MAHAKNHEPHRAGDEDDSRPSTPLHEVGRGVIKRVYATKDAVVDQLIASAERIREEAFRSNDEVVIRQTQQLTRVMERAAVYLHSHTFDQMTGDATVIVRAKPWQAVVIAFLVGVIFGRSINRDKVD